jgi:hypothetical protein
VLDDELRVLDEGEGEGVGDEAPVDEVEEFTPHLVPTGKHPFLKLLFADVSSDTY